MTAPGPLSADALAPLWALAEEWEALREAAYRRGSQRHLGEYDRGLEVAYERCQEDLRAVLARLGDREGAEG